MEDNHNTIDVVIPLYNGEAFVGAAIESVLEQTVTPNRIVVVNDGSTDNSVSIVESYRIKTSIPIEIISQKNAGLSAARNAGIKHATAAYIAFLDADDTWLPEKLEEQLKVFNKSDLTELALVYCNYAIINPEGMVDPLGFVVPLDTTIRGKVFRQLLVGNKILSSGSGVLIKRSVFETVGLFNEALRFGEDWDMWLRIAETYTIDYTPKVLVHIRRHGDNMTASKRKVFEGEISFYRAWLPYLRVQKIAVPLRWKIKILYKTVTLFPSLSLIKKFLPVLFVPRNPFGK